MPSKLLTIFRPVNQASLETFPNSFSFVSVKTFNICFQFEAHMASFKTDYTGVSPKREMKWETQT